MFAISIANYVHEPALGRERRYDCPVLDTFDMLSPQYDQPQTQHEIEQPLSDVEVSLISSGWILADLLSLARKAQLGALETTPR